MTNRLSRRTTVLALLAVCALLLAACGGRFRSVTDQGDDDSSAGGSGAGRAGATAAGGPSAGATSGGAPGAGAPGAGAPGAGAPGAGGCGSFGCPAIKCAPGYEPEVQPGKCCPACVLSCQLVACPAVACAPGTHPEAPAGACCPVCVDDAGYACTKGKDSYQQQRAEFVDKYSYGCNSNAECTSVAPVNLCESGCQYAAISSGAVNNFTSNSSSFAAMLCSTCDPEPIPPCRPPPPPLCIANRCTFGGLL